MNYPQINTSECREIINARFESYRESTLHNMTRLGLRHLYYYANQSRFEYHNKEINSIYDQALIYTKNIMCATQLNPGDCVFEGHKILAPNLDDSDYFSFRMLQLESYINLSYKKIIDGNDFIPVKLLNDESYQASEHINYVAPKSVWNRILTGDLNIESIIIGGAGVVIKPNRNIRHHHMFMSKLSYVIQNRILNEGVLFFHSIPTQQQP